MRKRSKTEAGDRADCDVFTIHRGVADRGREAHCAGPGSRVGRALTAYAEQRDEEGRALVVPSGHHPERDIQTGIGPVPVQVPKVRSR
jgi:hypothetical protein